MVLTECPSRQFPPLHHEVVKYFLPVARQLLKGQQEVLTFAEHYVLNEGNLFVPSLDPGSLGDLAGMRRTILEQYDVGEWSKDGMELDVHLVEAVCLGYSRNPGVLKQWLREFYAKQTHIRLAGGGVV